MLAVIARCVWVRCHWKCELVCSSCGRLFGQTLNSASSPNAYNAYSIHAMKFIQRLGILGSLGVVAVSFPCAVYGDQTSGDKICLLRAGHVHSLALGCRSRPMNLMNRFCFDSFDLFIFELYNLGSLVT